MKCRKFYRLHQKLLRPGLNCAGAHRQASLAGEHQHGKTGIDRLHVPQQLRGVAVGKGKVEDRGVRAEALKLLPRVVTVGRFGHDVPVRP